MNFDADFPDDAMDSNASSYEPLSAREACEVQRLVSALCDHVISDDAWNRLTMLLRDSEAARAVYLDAIRLHGDLITIAGRYAGNVDLYVLLNDLEQTHVLEEKIATNSTTALEPAPKNLFRTRKVGAILGGMLLASLLGVSLWVNDPQGLVHPSPHPTRAEVLPKVTFVSPRAHWIDRQVGAQTDVPTDVSLGHIVAIEEGKLELTYPCGTKVWLFGPSEFQVATGGGYLYRGDIVARVSPAGHGFTVLSRIGKIVDLGTEFSLVVDDLGVSRVSVFEGKVEAFVPHAHGNPLSNKIELESGSALQWSQDTDSVVKMLAPERHFDWAHLREMGDAVDPLARDARAQSRGVELALKWEVLGAIDGKQQGFVWSSPGEGSERAYCVSAEMLDPVQHPLELNCEWRTEQKDAGNATSFTVLTRTVNRRSGHPGQTWSDMLASGLRYSLKTFPEIGQANLEIAIKQEADREPSVIAMTRGLPLVPAGSGYQIRVYDDGVNVSFVVRHANNPDVVRSVRCRSLYRGEDNRIALEGGVGQQHVVQQLHVHQHQSPTHALSSSGEASSLALARSETSSPSPIPWDPPGLGAQLLVEDNFGTEQLNAARWQTLGNVLIQGGRCQLGVANPTQHIDTWQHRPYLIFRQPVDTRVGRVVILGRITFSDNVLRGYGGSFAAFTRAKPNYGSGASWERSILVSGLRANFWPGAEGFGHSLEIHERKDGQAVKLLAATGFAIRPESREYAFRLTDDGVTASLTVADLSDPSLQQSISHISTAPLAQPGYLAFESCWGSPVWIDDIRVYQMPAESK